MRAALAAAPRGAAAVAHSGGLDSTALLHAAAQARSTGPLRVLHVNHGLHAQADAWERRSRALAASLGVDFLALRVAVAPGNLQANARRARYRAWRRTLRAGEALLLAHHADDQAETVLWQLATGRAPAGMPRSRPLGAGRLERPFLRLRRSVLAEYAAARGLSWIEDPRNADTRFDRAYLRHEVLPRLAARFPGAATAIAASVDAAFSAAPAAPLPLRGLSAASLRAWLGVAVPERFVREVLRQAAARADANPIARLPGGLEVRRHDGCLHKVRPFIAATGAAHASEFGAAIRRRAAPGRRVELAHGTLHWRKSERGLPSQPALAIRYRAGAERIAPAGRGVSKRLKALFQEARTPPWLRDAWPLLFDGGDLVAVPGIAIAEGRATGEGWMPLWTPTGAAAGAARARSSASRP